MTTTIAIFAIWAIGVVLAWFAIKEWLGSRYTGTREQMVETGILSMTSWCLFILYAIYAIHVYLTKEQEG